MRPAPDELISSAERAEWATDENPGKYNAIFERRARRGQCFNQPYLGCREFSCSFRLVEELGAEPGAIEETRDLGFMLYDLDFTDERDPKPAFFRAQLNNGVIDVPPWESDEVRK
jgi:CRISPR-associated protein Cas5d